MKRILLGLVLAVAGSLSAVSTAQADPWGHHGYGQGYGYGHGYGHSHYHSYYRGGPPGCFPSYGHHHHSYRPSYGPYYPYGGYRPSSNFGIYFGF